MKTLNAEQLVALLPANPALVDEALRTFEAAAPVLCRAPGSIKNLIAEGWMETAQIDYQNKPAFILGFHLTQDRGLWIDVAQTLKVFAPISALVTGCEMLARKHNARYVRLLTYRRGLVKVAQSHGYQPEAVLLTKVL